MLRTDAPLKYDTLLESALNRISDLLEGGYGMSNRGVALLLLQEDSEIDRIVREKEPNYTSIQRVVEEAKANYNGPLAYRIALERQEATRRILTEAVTTATLAGTPFGERLSRAMMHPVSGVIILLIVLYFGLYQFVGVLGAGVLVNFIEGTIFGKWLNPWVTGLVTGLIPSKTFQDLFVGSYGIITLGFTYAFALILPIVSTFFIVFSIIEDSGYLPRLAMLVDRLFKTIGLSGRAVIPMVLGFGCDTMATIVTRTQETKRERVISTLLLALAIPCSAQLGVVMAILSGSKLALIIWAGVVLLVFLLVGYLAGRVLPGKKPTFYMELPPLRLPKPSNVLVKTYTRLQWYFVEVLPVFILTSVLLWVGDITGVLKLATSAVEPLVRFIGLPPQTAVAFLYGFFRRDFGAAGLYELNSSGVLVGIPLVVAAVTLTLFVPCVAQFTVMAKERGLKTALAIALFIFPFAFLAGAALNWALITLGVKL